MRSSCYEKGGASFVLFSLAARTPLSERERELSYKMGAACQLADDIYDRGDDVQLGQSTLASARLLRGAERRLLAEATMDLPRWSGLAPRAFREAWNGYFRDALDAYDRGSLGGWKYDLGQWVFRLGLSIVPAIPLWGARGRAGGAA